MKPSDVLKAARKLIETPDKWCQKKARVVDPDGKTVCRCAVTAIDDAGTKRDDEAGACNFFHDWLRNQGTPLAARSIVIFNDESTHETVLWGFDGATELALKAGQ